MKKVFLKDVLKEGKTLPSFKKVTKEEIDDAKKYLEKEYAKLEKLKRIDPHMGDLFVGN